MNAIAFLEAHFASGNAESYKMETKAQMITSLKKSILLPKLPF